MDAWSRQRAYVSWSLEALDGTPEVQASATLFAVQTLQPTPALLQAGEADTKRPCSWNGIGNGLGC